MIVEHREKLARLCLEWDRTDAKNAGDRGFGLACAVTSLLYALGLVKSGRLTPEGETLADEARASIAATAKCIAEIETAIKRRLEAKS